MAACVRFRITTALFLFVTSAIAVRAQETADQAVRKVLDGLEENRFEVLWEALPVSYQADVVGVRNDFVDRVDRELWHANFRVIGKLARIFEEKKEFILGHPMVAPQLASLEDSERVYDGFVGFFSAIAHSDLADLDRLRQTDMGEFLRTSFSDLAARLRAVAEQVPQASEAVGQFSGTTVELVSQDGDSAVVRITDKDSSGETEFRRVEGKWLPADIVDDWSEKIGEVRSQLAAIPVGRSEEAQKFLVTLQGVEPLLDGVLAAQTAEEFNSAVQMLVGGVMAAWAAG